MCADGCANNIYIIKIAYKNDTWTVSHQRHPLGFVMEELERNSRAVTLEVPKFACQAMGEQGAGLSASLYSEVRRVESP